MYFDNEYFMYFIVIINLIIIVSPWYSIPKSNAKKLKQIVKLFVCFGWSENWAGRFPKEWQEQTESKC